MPPVVMGAPYWEPKLHALALKKLQPLNLTAGSASTSKVMNTNPSISTGTTAPPRPSQRIRPPLRAQARSAAPARRRGGVPAPPPGGTLVAEVAMKSQPVIELTRLVAIVCTFEASGSKATADRYLEPAPVVSVQFRNAFSAVAVAASGCVFFTIAYS